MYVDSVSVVVFELYRMIDDDSSVSMVIQLMTAPDMIPFAIIGMVISTNVFILEEPRLSAASSTVIGICWSAATLLRMV